MDNLQNKSTESLRQLLAAREAEKSALDTRQQALKVLLNSCYGALGNQWYRYFNLTLAEAITTTGQVIIQRVKNGLNTYFNNILKTPADTNYCVAGDTDSVLLKCDKIVEKFLPNATTTKIVDGLDIFCNKFLQPVINKQLEELGEYFNCPGRRLGMKRETIAQSGLFVAKKRYALLTLDKEGVRYHKPKLAITGIEAVKSSTPQACRKMIKSALNLILHQDQDKFLDFMKKQEVDFRKLPPDEIAFPRGIQGLEKYRDENTVYKKGTPIHVKGALVFNWWLRKNGLEKVYPIIESGGHVKFIYLKRPNPFLNVNAISVPSIFPPEMNIEKYIDFRTQFQKAFQLPIKLITDKIGWQIERQNTIESIFA